MPGPDQTGPDWVLSFTDPSRYPIPAGSFALKATRLPGPDRTYTHPIRDLRRKQSESSISHHILERKQLLVEDLRLQHILSIVIRDEVRFTLAMLFFGLSVANDS